MERNLKIERLRTQVGRLAPEGGLERLAQDERALEQVAAAPADAKEEVEDRVRGAVRRLAEHSDLADEDLDALEAIVLPRGRPVVDVVNDRYLAPGGVWAVLGLDLVRARVERAIPSVGRVELVNHPQLAYGGTGFVVGPDLVMTNRHVAEIFASGLGARDLRFLAGRGSAVDFKKEHGVPDEILIQVRAVLMVHPFWDMALLRVDGLPPNQRPLELSTVHPDELAGRRVAVLGYPAMDTRNDIALQLEIFRGTFDVKRLQPGEVTGRRRIRSFDNVVDALTHDASTLGGNSGSAVLDLETGQVVGLHFAGRYLESNYAVPTHELARDRRVVDAGVNIRGSVAAGKLPWEPHWLAADPLFESDVAVAQPQSPHGANARAAAGPAAGQAGGPRLSAGAGSVTWTIPLEVTVSLGGGALALRPASAGPAVSGIAAGAASAAPAVEAPRTIPDPDYSNRTGYDQAFLGPAHTVRLPWLGGEQFDDVAFNSQASSRRKELTYHHFSVVMSRSRRVAYLTAVNIDGALDQHVSRDDFEDHWVFDPRIPENVQLDNEFYRDLGSVSNPLDRGHLVRRLDPCWGATRAEVIAAHHDTFHWTNSSPQHLSFNRSAERWLGIEDHVLANANARNLRVTVFSGPVLKGGDPVYTTPTGHQVQLPTDYWKVVVFVKADGARSASGYLLSQQVEVDALTETFDFGDFNGFQVAITELEELTGLTFLDTQGFDPLEGALEGPGGRRPRLPLGAYERLRL